MANTSLSPEDVHAADSEYLNSDASCTFDALLSLLLFNGGDLSCDESHSHLDKKSLLRLCIQLKYTAVHAPEFAGEFLHADNSPDVTGKHAAYYVYRLRKLVI